MDDFFKHIVNGDGNVMNVGRNINDNGNCYNNDGKNNSKGNNNR